MSSGVCSATFFCCTCALWHIAHFASSSVLTSVNATGLAAAAFACADGGGGASQNAKPTSAIVPTIACSQGARLCCTCALWRATKLWRISAPASISSTSTSQLCGPWYSQP